jgi:hypothetical protein
MPCELPGMLCIYSEASLYRSQILFKPFQNGGLFPLLVRKQATPSGDNQERNPWHCKRDEGSHAENLCGKADTSLRMFHRPFSVQIQASQHQTWTVDAGTVRGQSGVGERYPKEVRLPGNTGGVFLEFKSIIVRLALPPPNWVVKC